MQQLKSAHKAALADCKKAQLSYGQAESKAQASRHKVLCKAPAVAGAAAEPLIDAFQLRLERTEEIQWASTALSLLLAPYQDVLVVPKLTNVQECAQNQCRSSTD